MRIKACTEPVEVRETMAVHKFRLAAVITIIFLKA
jgi:hypothetical protein